MSSFSGNFFSKYWVFWVIDKSGWNSFLLILLSTADIWSWVFDFHQLLFSLFHLGRSKLNATFHKCWWLYNTDNLNNEKNSFELKLVLDSFNQILNQFRGYTWWILIHYEIEEWPIYLNKLNILLMKCKIRELIEIWRMLAQLTLFKSQIS